MESPSRRQISEEEKIKILLQEYATLRQEVIARTTHGFQLLSVGSVVLAWMMTTQKTSGFFWPGLSIAVIVYLIAIWFTLRDINKATARLRQLEQDVNRRAGEDLLVWESRWGGAVTGFWGPARPIEQRLADHLSLGEHPRSLPPSSQKG